jgi:L-ribulose-5-phosphate 4-epimerase
MTASQRIERLRIEVYEANMQIHRDGLVFSTFGNASGIDRESGTVIIKPSGVPYDELSPGNMVAVDLHYRVLEGDFRPSSDTKTHAMLYRFFEHIGGVVHTHSKYATAWAQAAKPLECLGTTHADYFHGEVPCTDVIRDEQIAADYEEETARQILETFERYDYRSTAAVLVASHGPFTWGTNPIEAAYHAAVLEYIAEMNHLTLGLRPGTEPIKKSLLDKHYLRKHGAGAYYGQNPQKNRSETK